MRERIWSEVPGGDVPLGFSARRRRRRQEWQEQEWQEGRGDGEWWWPSWLPRPAWLSPGTAPPLSAPPPTPSPTGFLKDDPTLAKVQLTPAKPIAIDSKWPQARRDLAGAYNRLGGLMQALASRTGGDVGGVLAVWQVETAGRSHTPGRAIIRFENHVFWDQWGKSNAAVFDQHYTYGGHNGVSGNRWENHKFREKTSAAFETSHPSKNQQDAEYRAFRLAISLAGNEPAIKSISLGGPQVMGFNYKLLGYASAKDLYDNFQANERWHVLGFFDFCKSNKILGPLGNHAWVDFAKVYNGSGNATVYGAKLKAAYDEAAQLPIGPAAPTLPAQAPSTGGAGPNVTVNSGVVVSSNAVNVLKSVLRSAGLSSATITSGRRTSADQARVMYDLIRARGVAYAKNLYAAAGDKVIDVYAASVAAGKPEAQIKLDMQNKIVALGPSTVSLHTSDTHDVFDVAPSSIKDQAAFRRALDAAVASGQISKVIAPPIDPAFHIEIRLAGDHESEVARRILRAPPLRMGRSRPRPRPRKRSSPQGRHDHRFRPAFYRVLWAPPLPISLASDPSPVADVPSDEPLTDAPLPLEPDPTAFPAADGVAVSADGLAPTAATEPEWEVLHDCGGGCQHGHRRSEAVGAFETEVEHEQVTLPSADSALVPAANVIPASACHVDRSHPRGLTDIRRVVIHTFDSSADFKRQIEIWRTATSGDDCNKPHYAVGKGGQIAQVIAERDIAPHAGAANRDSIGIEHEGRGNDPGVYTEAMLVASAALTRDICQRHHIPMDRQHVVGHAEVGGHGDPGAYWDWDYYMALVNWDGSAATKPVRMVSTFEPGQGIVGPRWRSVARRAIKSDEPYYYHSWARRTFVADPEAKPDADGPASCVMVINVPGTYEVSAWWPVLDGNNAAAHMTIERIGSKPTAPFLEVQKLAPPPFAQNARNPSRGYRTVALPYTLKWFSLGKLDCRKGDVVIIEVSRHSTAKGVIVADAVRLLKR